jgi:hypothetical protein
LLSSSARVGSAAAGLDAPAGTQSAATRSADHAAMQS